MEDIEIVKSFRSMKLDSRSLLVLLDGIQKGTVTIQWMRTAVSRWRMQSSAEKGKQRKDADQHYVDWIQESRTV